MGGRFSDLSFRSIAHRCDFISDANKMASVDYIIVGGGIGGCVVASRLHQKYPSASLLLIEAGPDVSKHPMIVNSTPTPMLQHSELDWDYKTTPQKHLGNKICFGAAGKALGGGSAINACRRSCLSFFVASPDF